AEELYLLLGPVSVGQLVRRPVALCHLAGAEVRRLQAGLGPGLRAHSADVLFDRGVATIESLFAEDLEHALDRDVGVLSQELADALLVGIELRCARSGRFRLRERRVLGLALHRVLLEDAPDGVAADAERGGDGATADFFAGERDHVLHQLFARRPPGHAASSEVLVPSLRRAVLARVS